MQRIFLCSDQHEKHTPTVNAALFDSLKDTNQRILYIPSEPDGSRRYFRKCADYYGYLGFSDVTYFDLGFEYDARRLPDLASHDVIHLSGGRTAPFLRSMAAKGFAARLDQHLSNGGIIVGVSAGAMILGTCVFAEPEEQRGNKSSSGIRVLGFDLLPHFGDTAQEISAIGGHQKRSRLPVWAIGEDCALICSRAAAGDPWQTDSVDPHGLSRYFGA